MQKFASKRLRYHYTPFACIQMHLHCGIAIYNFLTLVAVQRAVKRVCVCLSNISCCVKRRLVAKVKISKFVHYGIQF